MRRWQRHHLSARNRWLLRILERLSAQERSSAHENSGSTHNHSWVLSARALMGFWSRLTSALVVSPGQKLQKVTDWVFKTSALSALAERSGAVFERSSGGWRALKSAYECTWAAPERSPSAHMSARGWFWPLVALIWVLIALERWPCRSSL